MPEFNISDVKVIFPFEPYKLQHAYMEKVIECLENGFNGVLESPTGTGKTLCLLCSALGWITKKKAEFHADLNAKIGEVQKYNLAEGIKTENLPLLKNLAANFRETFENVSENQPGATKWAVPKIIYASRTHSQLTQAMQELKRTSYNHMKAAVIGSRDQLCIHPEVQNETGNSNKIHMCKLKITTRTCSFYHKVEAGKDDPIFRQATIMDIEDLVVAGRKKKCCPYFVSRELIPDADIVFMPYNYLLDPMARKANKVDLNNTIVILDEAHNVEKMCEESASVQISSTEIAVCIDDVTHIMKAMEENRDMGETSKDFNIEHLVSLKETLLSLENTIDAIQVDDIEAGQTFAGAYIFELLANANITDGNFSSLSRLLDSLIQFLTTVAEQNSAFRRGSGLQKLVDLLIIVFSSVSEDYKERVSKCYKVHVEIEQTKAQRGGTVTNDGWIQPKATTLKKNNAKVISYWCFSPGFGMQQLLGKNVRSIILTSGTLAPLKPLISELCIPIEVRLENPHIVTSAQVCVKIVSCGPDKEPLISNYGNRANPKYINSLGRTILSLCPVIPHGLLVFFTSYFMLNKCRDSWQASGIWSQIQRHKPIFIEPQSKDVFIATMSEYYARINDPVTKGAIFMAVCRGKVSEGLDFADMNGRAVIITGLPFPPFKDPRIILKKKYLQDNRTAGNEMLSGDEWYFLEATRAVNQAIGRVIRHKDDYGAILLCDQRFNQQRQKNQLSSWIQGHLKGNQPTGFGPLIGEISRFFRNAERTLPTPGLKPRIPEIDNLSPPKLANSNTDGLINYKFENKILKDVKVEPVHVEKSNSVFGWDDPAAYKVGNLLSTPPKPADFLSRLNQQVTTIDFNNFESPTPSLVGIHKRERTSPLFTSQPPSQSSVITKKRKFRLVPNEMHATTSSQQETTVTSTIIEKETLPQNRKDLLKLLKSSLSPPHYMLFIKALTDYQNESKIDSLIETFRKVFEPTSFHYLFRGMRRFVKDTHKESFDAIVETLI